jgi:hypothetical protein
MTSESLVLLSVRGTLVPTSLEAACRLHNETAGSAPGIAAARELGDLSHKVYSPVTGAPGAEPGELLFLDVWASAEGIGRFFSNKAVLEQGTKLFSKRDATIWAPAPGSFGFDLPAPRGKDERYLGVVRGPVASKEQAIGAFRATLAPKLADARRRGQLSHMIFFKLPMPGDSSPPELFGLDVWCDGPGMQEHYREISGLDRAFSGAPQMSVWEQAAGGSWSEW